MKKKNLLHGKVELRELVQEVLHLIQKKILEKMEQALTEQLHQIHMQINFHIMIKIKIKKKKKKKKKK